MRIEAVVGDITTEKVDAIVNAANSTLLGGGGVDGAIHRAAGPGLLDACQKVRDTELPDGLPVGRAVATPGFDLPATWVIHTVGPNLHAGEDDPALLRACFDSSLELAIQLGCTGIALPAVSAGVYGWQIARVAEIAVAAARAVEQLGLDLLRDDSGDLLGVGGLAQGVGELGLHESAGELGQELEVEVVGAVGGGDHEDEVGGLPVSGPEVDRLGQAGGLADSVGEGGPVGHGGVGGGR